MVPIITWNNLWWEKLHYHLFFPLANEKIAFCHIGSILGLLIVAQDKTGLDTSLERTFPINLSRTNTIRPYNIAINWCHGKSRVMSSCDKYKPHSQWQYFLIFTFNSSPSMCTEVFPSCLSTMNTSYTNNDQA